MKKLYPGKFLFDARQTRETLGLRGRGWYPKLLRIDGVDVKSKVGLVYRAQSAKAVRKTCQYASRLT